MRLQSILWFPEKTVRLLEATIHSCDQSIELTYSIDFPFVVPNVYIIVQQRLVHGNASLRVDHEHARQ